MTKSSKLNLICFPFPCEYDSVIIDGIFNVVKFHTCQFNLVGRQSHNPTMTYNCAMWTSNPTEKRVRIWATWKLTPLIQDVAARRK
jgi:hypothetical protein